MKERKDIFWRAWLVYAGFMGLMLVVIYNTLSLQMEEKDNVLDRPQSKIPTRVVPRIPRRGEIMDINYTPLVTSVSFYDIHMDPTTVEEKLFNKDISSLSFGLNLLFPEKTAREYENEIRTARNRGSRYLLIKRKATNEERKKLRELPIFSLGRFKGGFIDTDENIERKRPHDELMRRTLGYYQNENGRELKVGIEGAFNDYLAGVEGQELEQRYSNGWKKTGQIVREAVEGADVITTIDKEIQEVAHNELYNQLKNQGAKNGCVVVMDVKTGYVKAIVNLSRLANGEYSEIYNYAIGTKEVPGSTFKLASLMAALEDKKINIDDTVNAYGQYKFYNSTLTDSHEGGYGKITIRQAFEKSSNVISKVIYNAYRSEPKTYVDRLRSFGLGDKLRIDLQGEPDPTLYAPGSKNWSGISLAWMSIGYEVQQTPLQTLAFYNAVANNGKLVRPQFVKEIRRGGELVKTFDPIVLKKQICSPSTIAILQECLEGVVLRGTGSDLKSSLFDIAGKTGTAKILNDNLSYGVKGEEKYQASFVGYFPAKDPIYSCIVVVSAPSKDIYGAVVSGTVFSAIANKVYATSLRYHEAINEKKEQIKKAPISMAGNRHDLTQIMKMLHIGFSYSIQDEYIRTSANDQKIDFQKYSNNKNFIPDLRGMSARDAVYLIESRGMFAKIKGYGSVISQSMAYGTPVQSGALIEIELK